MESKDLILLMLIPLILISLITYTDKNPVITGAVTQEQKKDSNIIGTYSIIPSFKAKVDYDLNDYNKIRESFDIVSSCAKSNDLSSCVNDINSDDNTFKWELNCDKGPEKILYDFAEFLQDCFDSEDNNCLCRKNLELAKEKINEYGLSNSRYGMTLTVEPKKIRVQMSEPKKDLHHDIKPAGISVWYPARYIIAYTDEKLFTLELIFKDEIDRNIEYKYAFPKQKDITLYKNEINGVKRVDFVKQENDNLKYPNDKIITDSNSKPIDVKEIRDCDIKPKNIYKFCVTKKEYKTIAYDGFDGQVKERPLTIKFAAYVPQKESITI